LITLPFFAISNSSEAEAAREDIAPHQQRRRWRLALAKVRALRSGIREALYVAFVIEEDK